MKIGQKVVYIWLGSEYIGTLEEIIEKDGDTIYRVKSQDGGLYRCTENGRFGIILIDETIKLNEGSYIKKIKTEEDLMIEELEVMFNKLKELNEQKYPKKRKIEFKNLIKDIRKKLMDLQRNVIEK